MFVNLAAPLILPPHRHPDHDHYTAVFEQLSTGGWVKLKIRDGILSVDDSSVTEFVDPRQKTHKPPGHDLYMKFRDKGAKVLHPNILDAMLVHKHFAPGSFVVDAAGQPRGTLFYGATFRNQDNGVGARMLYRGQDRDLHDYCVWLGNGLDCKYAAAICAPDPSLLTALYY